MANTGSRTLGLLPLLHTHRHWPGVELLDRLEVSGRTLRRDVTGCASSLPGQRDPGYGRRSVSGAPSNHLAPYPDFSLLESISRTLSSRAFLFSGVSAWSNGSITR